MRYEAGPPLLEVGFARIYDGPAIERKACWSVWCRKGWWAPELLAHEYDACAPPPLNVGDVVTARVDLTARGAGSVRFARNGRDMGVLSTTVEGPVRPFVNMVESNVVALFGGDDVGELVDREDSPHARLTRGDWNDGNTDWNADDEVEMEAADGECKRRG